MNRMCFIWNLAKGNEKLALHIQIKVKQQFDWSKTNQNNRILCSRSFFIVSADYLNDPIALEREPNEVSIQLSSEMLCVFV